MSDDREYNFDGLVGPTHHFAGLSLGNVASIAHAKQMAYPKQAALQGLAKMHMLSQQGILQAVLPPHMRPNLACLRQLGFIGRDEQILKEALEKAPQLLSAVYSASAMWVANAATVSPSIDTQDKRVHLTVANCQSKLHRSIESVQTEHILRSIFYDERYFVVHGALPATAVLGDEGAANHMRLACKKNDRGINIFVYGRSEYQPGAQPHHYVARQTLEASQAVARIHGLSPENTFFMQQHPAAIDQGVFHNDVIATATGRILLYHQRAFLDNTHVIDACKKIFDQYGEELLTIEVKEEEVSLKDAVSSYLFNSQLLAKPNGQMLLLLPTTCQNNPSVDQYLQQLIHTKYGIDNIMYVNLHESMCNGGGPACLRLRVLLTQDQASAIHQGVVLNEALYARLVKWVNEYYRDTLTFEELADPLLITEVQNALYALADILNLPKLYSFS